MLVNPTPACVFVVSSDWHTGSTVGLMPEHFKLIDGQVVYPSAEQEWLLEGWHDLIDFTKRTAGKRPVYHILNGDPTENLHHQTTQLWSFRQDEHELAAIQVAQLWDFVDEWRVVRGTPAHTGQGAQMEERIARALGCKPVGHAHTVHNYWGEFSGVRIQVAHHRGGNYVPWTRGNAMRTVVLKMKDFCFENDLEPPHLVFRSHKHKAEDTYKKYSRRIRGIALGAWQLATEYVYRIETEDILADVHAVVVECDGGKYEVHHFRPDMPESMMPQYEILGHET